ncbi:Syntaxin/t-SNARE family protein [Striga hermonthica]|uniref:Syntaxin/t-SNARE family protein n=1 Tax=Striga hermonthica TaxID=68872 RepID=A0A9N7NFB7_STRHE|nr:Syntaxin/t-SNARE family protein [Striga hermonthica]
MREWESDPHFAAAEVVQDSADRMESIFRLLLHEQSLVHEHPMDEQLLSSIECHKRDLSTAMETAKWQLEDFEREVNLADKFQLDNNVILRHVKFIGAIREQIIHVEQSMDASLGNQSRNMNLNEHDRDRLELFLTGEIPVEHMAGQDSADDNMLRRFLDPATSSSPRKYIDENNVGEIVNLNADEISYRDRNNMELKNSLAEMDLGPSVSFEGANTGMHAEEGTWDLEANHAIGRSNLQRNKLEGYFGRMNIFRSLGNFRFSRSFTKRLKDGEEQRQSQLFSNFYPGMQRSKRNILYMMVIDTSVTVVGATFGWC